MSNKLLDFLNRAIGLMKDDVDHERFFLAIAGVPLAEVWSALVGYSQHGSFQQPLRAVASAVLVLVLLGSFRSNGPVRLSSLFLRDNYPNVRWAVTFWGSWGASALYHELTIVNLVVWGLLFARSVVYEFRLGNDQPNASPQDI